MSKWILSSREAIEKPFILKNADFKISSLDELAFLMENGKIIFAEDVMNEEFCDWVSQELADRKTGESLKQIMKAKASAEVFFQCVFRSLFYVEDLKIKEFMMEFADVTCTKAYQKHYYIGNQYFRAAKYRSSIFEYRQALQKENDEEEENGEDIIWRGKVWHQLGNCYIHELRFKEAVDCFQTAYLLNYDNRTQSALALAKQAYNNEISYEEEETLCDEELEQAVFQLKREMLRGIR